MILLKCDRFSKVGFLALALVCTALPSLTIAAATTVTCTNSFATLEIFIELPTSTDDIAKASYRTRNSGVWTPPEAFNCRKPYAGTKQIAVCSKVLGPDAGWGVTLFKDKSGNGYAATEINTGPDGKSSETVLTCK